MSLGAAAGLGRRLDAAIFDWDGTAVPDRRADAHAVRCVIEGLCARGFDVAVVSGTHLANVDEQLRARPKGPGKLHFLLNRGSEVYLVDGEGPRLLERRVASPREEAALTAAAELTIARLKERGIEASLVANRLNRRKIDLIPEWVDPPKSEIDELLKAVEARLHKAGMKDLRDVIALAISASREVGLPDPRVTSDAKNVEIGLTDKSDSARWIFRDLWRRGIGPGLTVIAGDELGPLGGAPGSDSLMLVGEAARAMVVSVGIEPNGVPEGVLALGGGPRTFVALLQDQLARREREEPPRADLAPGWIFSTEGFDPTLERVREAQLTIADGRIGTSGNPLECHAAMRPRVLAANVYAGEGWHSHLLHCPTWNCLPEQLEKGDKLVRVLDLRTGILHEQFASGSGRRTSAVFSSLARPGVVTLRAEGSAHVLPPSPPLRKSEEGVAVVGDERHREGGEMSGLERIAAYETGDDPDLKTASDRLKKARSAGYERLLAEHRTCWAKRWEDGDVAIEGDDALQLAVRFALFHLMASVGDEGEAAVGARGLSGPAYQGHVFWDSDVFVLPFLAATHPPAARAMLEYRIRRLPAAREAARREARNGARFPWESAKTGLDVTPPTFIDSNGAAVGITNGECEEHIVADVAWGASCYLAWTGDRAFAEGPGLSLLVETARYWASRVRSDLHGRGHIYDVIGPDEYHVLVDDNAFTNGMARWNLRRAAELVRAVASDVREEEWRGWLELADTIVDGYDPATRLYEQFTGFSQLEPLIISDAVSQRPIAADMLLGYERVRGAQIVKQADALMLFHLLPDDVAPGSLDANLDFYEPRTAHGSSLSPGIHAALFARAGRTQEALDLLKLTSRIDLDDLTETTAGGIHLAAMGSVWHALALGFAGLKPHGSILEIDPKLPRTWRALEVRVRFRGTAVRLRLDASSATVECDGPLRLKFPHAEVLTLAAGSVRLERRAQWDVVQ